MSLHLEWQLGWAISDSVMVVLSDIRTCANDWTSTAFPLFPYRQCPLGYWQVHRRGEACLWGLGNGSKWASWNLDYGTRFRECRIVFHGVDTNLSVEIFRFPRLASWRQVYNCRSLLCPLEYVVDRIGIDLKAEFPEVYKWTKRMMRRPAVVRALTEN